MSLLNLSALDQSPLRDSFGRTSTPNRELAMGEIKKAHNQLRYEPL